MSIIIIILISVLNSNCQYDDQQQNYDDQYQQNPVQYDYTGDESKFLPNYYENPVPDFVQDQGYLQFQMVESIDDGPQMLYNLPLPRQNTQRGDESCICVPNGMCPTGPVRVGGIATHGPSNVQSAGPQSPFATQAGAAPISSCEASTDLNLCCIPGPYQCGMIWPAVRSAPVSKPGETYHGQYPWQAVLLSKAEVYLGSGALIDNFNILTAAHKVSNYTASAIKVRMGDWDASNTNEPIKPMEFDVSAIVVHPNYEPKNLKNGIALIRLSSPVPLGMTPTIATICLPSTKFEKGTCFVSGWGKEAFEGAFQAIQRETDVPLVDIAECQSKLQKTRLGSDFKLDPQAYICAGGVKGKDACTGDGGSPLVCEDGGKWYLAGLVAWGIGCGENSVPGVYINIHNYLTWIQGFTQ